MRRREFITLSASAAVAPLPAQAQQSGRLPTIGFLGSSTASAWSDWAAAFVQGMRERGWIEGRTVTIEYRWADGSVDRYGEIAAEFVRLKVDVIVTVGSAVPAARQATSVIPIVFAVATDPIGGGLVTSLARPLATSLDCPSNRPILSANGSSSCGRFSPAPTGWQSSPTRPTPLPCWR